MRCTDRYIERSAAILRCIRYATVATVTADGMPWNSPVYMVIDDRLRLYWISDKESQHSRNIRHSGAAFIVIYDSTVPEGEGEGVYIRARVRELEDAADIQRIRTLKKGIAGDPLQFMGDGVRRVYEAIPEQMWTNDAEVRDGQFIRDYRVALPVAEVLRAFIGRE